MMQDIEYSSPEEIRQFQDTRLREALAYLNTSSRYYRRLFERYNVNVGNIRHVEDLVSIPFTEKKDLQLFNEDFLCVPQHKVIDYITTSGTMSDPVTFCCTEKDLQRLAYNERKSFECAGLRPGNILQLMVTLDKRFMAGMAYFLGLRELGASVVRVGNGIPELQWDTISRIKPDSIMCVPSFIPRLMQYAEEHGIDYRKSSVRKIIGIGESLRNQDFSLNLLGNQIKSKWDVELYATYSSTEMGATFSECEYGVGGHVHPELIIVEIIGDDNLPVPDGEVGEVVVTTLGVEGMPLLRFRTGDICAKIVDKCPCGRNSYRLTPLVGRKNNMIKLKGTTLYPPAMMDVLNNTPFVSNYVIYVKDSKQGTDEVVVKIGLDEEYVSQNTRFREHPEEIINEMKNRFRAHVRVAPEVCVEPVEEIRAINFPQSARKPVKFVDLRQKH
ncbi:MAG: AMP-binding protein [Bacteroidales bacterium]|nr:AMP-binding protein [Bacteroidales bacterium]MDY6346955.1 AMP-binding protein [Bacteroidales bacterium]